MIISFSNHALRRMAERSISRDDVEAAIAHPDKVTLGMEIM